MDKIVLVFFALAIAVISAIPSKSTQDASLEILTLIPHSIPPPVVKATLKSSPIKTTVSSTIPTRTSTPIPKVISSARVTTTIVPITTTKPKTPTSQKPSTITSAPPPSTKRGSVSPTPTTTVASTVVLASTTPKTPTTRVTTSAPPTTPAPVMTPETPSDARPTIPYATNTPGKEFKVAIVLTEKSFDSNLNIPASFQFLELKKMLEQSLTEIFRSNAEFISVHVLSFRPAVYKPPETSLPGSPAKANRRSSVPLKGVEVTLEFKLQIARPGLLVPLETQLKIGSIASHVVSPEMAAVIIKERESCPTTCRQPNVCFPSCSATCCSAPQVQSCPSPCSHKCYPSCNKACCTLIE